MWDAFSVRKAAQTYLMHVAEAQVMVTRSRKAFLHFSRTTLGKGRFFSSWANQHSYQLLHNGTQLSSESGMLRVYKNRSIQQAPCRNGRKFNRKQLWLYEIFLRLPSPFPGGENQTSDQSVWFSANCMQHFTFWMRQCDLNFCVFWS